MTIKILLVTSVVLMITDNFSAAQLSQGTFVANPIPFPKYDAVEFEHLNKKVICAINYPFNLSFVNFTKCNGILYNAGRVRESDSEVVVVTPDKDYIQNLFEIKKSHNMSLILSIGSWNSGTTQFQNLQQNMTKLAKFSKSVENLLSTTPFDSISLNWMWPGVGYRNGTTEDKTGLALIAEKVREGISSAGEGSLYMLLNGEAAILKEHYCLKKLSKIVDYFLLLAQDYHGDWEQGRVTNHPAPISKVKEALDYALSEIEPQKIILGIPLFGRTFLLLNSTTGDGLGQPFKGSFKSRAGLNGEMSYGEICFEIKNDVNWNVYWDEHESTLYMVNGQKWVSFDGYIGARAKVDLVTKKKLAGVFGWTMDRDDLQGECGLWGVVVGELGKSADHHHISQGEKASAHHERGLRTNNETINDSKSTKNSGSWTKMTTFAFVFPFLFYLVA